MNTPPLLSVHVLTYNSEKYIEATICSILMQKTSFKFEIVIGDDNSTDNTPNILTKFSEEHPNLINYKRNKEQLGILKNFKTTLDRCKGKYVFDIAGDDLLKHHYSLQKFVDVFEKDSSLGFVDSGYDVYFEKTKNTIVFANKSNIICSKNDYKNLLLLGRITPAGTCYKKQALYDFVEFDKYIRNEIAFEDYPILVDLAMNTNFHRINESLHIYRTHSESATNTKNFNHQVLLKDQLLELATYFSKKYHLPPDILNNHKKGYYQGMLYLAGRFGKRKLGKKMFLNLKRPLNIMFWGYFLCSQFKLIRAIAARFRKI
ncbi:glycosyltransferase family 2 protein [Flavisericum labens]|uniref:glycosyltransferase family 2 protein n=1 Tax=Flavisericum labens TaxID=3377112 RepID=UPI00387AC758